jgi:hypothetical protein
MRCTFRAPSGCRCTARAFIQVHHEWPWARGGGETVENLRLLCASHNRLLAERDFGAKAVQRAALSAKLAGHAGRAEPTMPAAPTKPAGPTRLADPAELAKHGARTARRAPEPVERDARRSETERAHWIDESD